MMIQQPTFEREPLIALGIPDAAGFGTAQSHQCALTGRRSRVAPLARLIAFGERAGRQLAGRGWRTGRVGWKAAMRIHRIAPGDIVLRAVGRRRIHHGRERVDARAVSGCPSWPRRVDRPLVRTDSPLGGSGSAAVAGCSTRTRVAASPEPVSLPIHE
jgi:hypothetical protein